MPRETWCSGDEPRENVLVGAIHFAPGRFVNGKRLFKASLGQGNLVGRAAGDVHREHRVLHPAPPTKLRHEVSGSSRSGKPRSSHEQS
jgi:hypothetical protein